MVAKGLLRRCLKLMNRKLEKAGLKVRSGKCIVDSTVIEAAARPRNTVEMPDDDEGPPRVSSSADEDARWTKKGQRYHYGYKEHALVDAAQGYIDDLEVTPANCHDGVRLPVILEGRRGIKEVLADKAYDSARNRSLLKERGIKNSILKRAARNRPLSRREAARNKRISYRRFPAEQQFGTKKRKFNFFRTRYFGLAMVEGQAFLKAICCNLLKAARRFVPTCVPWQRFAFA